MNIVDRIREKQKEARINGLRPEFIIITPTEYEELVDLLINEKDSVPIFTPDTPIILGMRIITNENQILRI